jgi:hypothetical protein
MASAVTFGGLGILLLVRRGNLPWYSHRHLDKRFGKMVAGDGAPDQPPSTHSLPTESKVGA